MYFSAARTQQYIDQVLQQLSKVSSISDEADVFIIPDFISLVSVIHQVRGHNIWCGAQDVFYENSGPYTGEVSPAVLAEVGCRLVEIGHAERRRIFKETDETIAKKAAAVVSKGMIPLVCIGEQTRGAAKAVDQCGRQVEAVLKTLPDEADVVFAYEPIWAIGAAEPAESEYISRVASDIRKLNCIQSRSGTVRIIYGGSAGPGLFAKIADSVDGLFLGRFAHDPAQFLKTICEVTKNT
jgi:triosephosphate isomerase